MCYIENKEHTLLTFFPHFCFFQRVYDDADDLDGEKDAAQSSGKSEVRQLARWAELKQLL